MTRAPRLTLKQTAQPSAEPITLAEAKAHIRVDTSDDDVLIASLISRARGYCEDQMRRQIMPATWRLTLDDFPRGRGRSPAIDGDDIILPRPPLAIVSAINYLNESGVDTTLSASSYVVSIDDEPGRISLAYGAVWPTTYDQLGAVRISYLAGYYESAIETANIPAIPKPIIQAILMLVGSWYESREATLVGTVSKEIEFAVSSLLSPHTLQEQW